MAQLMRAVEDTYQHYFYEKADHRSDALLLMGSPWPTVAITVLYIYFVQKLGPRLMSGRPAYHVDILMRLYNILNMAACAYIFTESVRLGWGWKFRFYCEPVDYSNEPSAVTAMKLTYCYFLLKVADLLDTVFFVLRKKQSQVTFLHVYHHTYMVLAGWVWAKYIPGGHGVVPGILNCFVHIWMYLYYLLTSVWPGYRGQLWWKRYITQLQMVQFVVVFLQSAPVFFMRTCDFPLLPCVLILLQAVAFFSLFLNFYIKAYKKQ